MDLEIPELLEKFAQVKVLVIGDVMLDRYWWGHSNRISPEAPVPVVQLRREELVAGGAANVAANVVGLGAEAFLIGVAGNDREADWLAETLEKTGISPQNLVRCEDRRTTLKTRVVVNHQQVARIDQETVEFLKAEEIEEVWRIVSECLNKIDVIVVSDYGKGFLGEKLLSRLITTAKNKALPILIDPKGKDYRKYRGATTLTPNRKEALEACQLEEGSREVILAAGARLLRELDLDSVLITEGEEGMTLFEREKSPAQYRALARHVFDVTGAGDTVIATLGTAVGAGLKLPEASQLANMAAGFVVEEIGTTTISKKRFLKSP